MGRHIDPDKSADCHSSGAVPTTAHAVRGGQDMTFCGHHLARSLGKLLDEGWEIIPTPRRPGRGVGTESTPNHYSVGGTA